MARNLENAVVVITGASSGIGRATALEFARAGARVVLAARRAGVLEEVEAECSTLGARTLVVPTDVSDAEAVERLAERAVEEFGRVDVWVNNAGVTMFGRFDEIPRESNRRVVETNLLGVFHGSHAALRRFRAQGGGVLINLSSGFGEFGSPLQAAYVSTKFGIRGLSEALRLETTGEDIHVCTVLPTAIDTPVYRQAANYTGRRMRPMGHLLEPEEVARAIVGLAREPKAETVVGGAVRGANVFRRLAPGLFRLVSSRQAVERVVLDGDPEEPHAGNLFAPMPEWRGVSGGYKQERRSVLRRALTGSLVVSAPATAALLWFRSRTGPPNR